LSLYFCHATVCSVVFFFLTAADGIRVSSWTGVQTCPLPIFRVVPNGIALERDTIRHDAEPGPGMQAAPQRAGDRFAHGDGAVRRSGERRGGRGWGGCGGRGAWDGGK